MEIQYKKGRPQCTKLWSQQVLRQALSLRRSALTLDRCPSGRSVVQDQSCQNHQQVDLRRKITKSSRGCLWLTWARRTRHFSSCCLIRVWNENDEHRKNFQSHMSPLGFIGITKLPPSAHDDKKSQSQTRNCWYRVAAQTIWGNSLEHAMGMFYLSPLHCSYSHIYLWHRSCYVHCSVQEGLMVLHWFHIHHLLKRIFQILLIPVVARLEDKHVNLKASVRTIFWF